MKYFGCGGGGGGGGDGGGVAVWPGWLAGWLVAIIRGQSHPKSTRKCTRGRHGCTKVTAQSTL
jgi:hypothetical protein